MAAHYHKVRGLTKRNDVIASTFGFDDSFKGYAASVDSKTRDAISALPEVRFVEPNYIMWAFVEAQSTSIIPHKANYRSHRYC